MRKYLLGTLIGVSALALTGGTVAFAQGMGNGNSYGSDSMLETKAEALGMTVDELEAAHETMDFEEIAAEQGVDIDAAMEQAAIDRWTERGYTEEEIAQRLETRSEARTDGEGPYSGGLGFGQSGNGQMNGSSGTGNGAGNGTGDCLSDDANA